MSLKRATDEKQSQSKSEWKFFIDRIYLERADFNWDTCSEVDNVKNMISTFESRLERVRMVKKQVASGLLMIVIRLLILFENILTWGKCDLLILGMKRLFYWRQKIGGHRKK